MLGSPCGSTLRATGGGCVKVWAVEEEDIICSRFLGFVAAQGVPGSACCVARRAKTLHPATGGCCGWVGAPAGAEAMPTTSPTAVGRTQHAHRVTSPYG